MKKSFTLKELAKASHSQFFGDENYTISNVSSLESATETDISFLSNPRYIKNLKTTQAGIICVDFNTPLIEGKNYLIDNNPSKVFQIITDLIIPCYKTGFDNIHPTAVIHESAQIHPTAQIGPYVTIDQQAKIGQNTQVFSHVSIGPQVEIGQDCLLHPSSIVQGGCILKNRVILQPGSVIGSCGFGYLTTPEGHHIKIKQAGIVVLEDDVEIGANTTIDRARFKDTLIKEGTKIDNLVQIAHNVTLGKHNIIVAQTGIAGSSKTGDYVIVGAQVGITGHIEISNGCQIAARSGVSKSLTQSGSYGGTPAIFFHEYNVHRVHLKKLGHYVKKIKDLEEKLQAIEERLNSK